MRSLRIPAVLGFTVLGVVGVAMAAAAGSCGDSKPRQDASTCDVLCVPESGGSSTACPLPTCATGSNHEICPAGCVPTPVV